MAALMSLYDAEFYELETTVAAESAAIVIPWIIETVDPIAIIDIGCGTGAWAAEAKRQGCEILGVDLDIPEDLLLIDEYINWDLTDPYHCSEWDLAICLEVAEHLPEETGPGLVRGLADAGSVLFSAATPGQPGVGHVNCREHDYWHALFAEYGLMPTHVGPRFTEPVADFYQRNMMLYRRTP